MFNRELNNLNDAIGILNKHDCTIDELRKEYRLLVFKYEKLVKDMMKITRIGDRQQNKLMNANEKIRQQKNELEDLNNQLREANAAKDKVFSIIAHDLRNPLQFLLFSSDLLGTEYKEGELEEKSIRKYIDKVFNTAKNMSELLENLLQWARSQYGEIECRPETVNIMGMVSEVFKFFNDSAEKKKIALQSRIDENITAYVDENMIKTVLRNLINNALKFTHPGGVITVTAEETPPYVVIDVIDNGVGIPVKKLSSLFSMGPSIITQGTNKEQGTGLGLILCKEFVIKNGGAIGVTSEPGKGSCFRFTLPKQEI